MHNLIFVASDAVDSLLNSGNYIAAILQIYIEKMGGPLFYGLVLLGIFGAFYIRYQSIVPILILMFLLFGTIRLIIPTSMIGMVLALLSIAAGILLYWLFMRR